MSSRTSDLYKKRMDAKRLPLRAACIHGRYEKHPDADTFVEELVAGQGRPGEPPDMSDWCPGGRDITIDYADVIYEWFDGQSLFAAWSDTQVRGYAIALAAAIGDTDD